ncbi:MAG: indolepyruvate ferredoxin oxidoreductase family protein [Candidatus Rokubacteria bacterium]|nr:indolepyruvate ferredoxin oxidoreductase family protein [Candidatus Rokubacteria bacterium]
MRHTHDLSLDSKYVAQSGRIFLSGIQALVRLPIDQHRADRRRGLDTATVISGYPGSPLGGFDLNVQRNAALLAEHNVHFIPGVNEELGATVVWGGQLSRAFPKPRYDGVLGMWYGKAPGVDRTGDLFRHANFAGVGPYGGVLAIAGDDPVAKSSTFPTASELAFYDLMFPVLFPGNVQEVLDLGRLGFELSRYSGCWVAFKIVTNVSDEVGTAEVAPERISIVDPGFEYDGKPWRATHGMVKFPPWGLQMERELFYGRIEAAKAFAAANHVNEISVDTPGAWLGVTAAGKTYYDLREALRALGLDDAALRRHGIRLLHLRMLFPLPPGLVREFARGLEELLVIEEKRSFVEMQMRDVLIDEAVHPRVIGKRDERGDVLVPADGELDADRIALILARRLERRISPPSITAHAALLEALRERPAPVTLARQSYFCSGCPHNRSTVVPEGSLAGGGIGCHSMAMTMDRRTVSLTQMGGEGVHWVGAAPFTEVTHFFQNLGDGTFCHSGSLAIRQAATARVNITFKILYNGTVAMTGGQNAAGALTVPDLTRLLQAEGVARVLVVADEPDKYAKRARWAPGVDVWHRDRLDEAQRVLRDTPGVTVLVYDQHCAAEKRRLRKRGRLADPDRRVLINEAVCEGCGDCGVKSNCMSVQPVDTELGRKTQIHQSSCNKDYSCLAGDCPSFVTFTPRGRRAFPGRRSVPDGVELPEPTLRVPRDAHLVMTGIGGTGVVTANQILGTAALLDGRHVRGLDQTGLSQKGGPVVSHLKISDAPPDFGSKVGIGGADCYLGFDILVATAPTNLDRARPERTVAVVSTTEIPTGAMVSSPDVRFPDPGGLVATINRVTRKDDNVFLDAVALAEALFDNHMMANPIVLGAAYQAGAIPVSAASIEAAIALNGVSVDANTEAFRAGRRAVADPAWTATLARPRLGAVSLGSGVAISEGARRLVDASGATGQLRRLLESRVPEIEAYQDLGYAREYTEVVARVAAAEHAAVPGQTRLAEAVARSLFKLMAYKDEYEVARLHLAANPARTLEREYPDGVELRYHLRPPLLRALGVRRKVAAGRWIEPLFGLLVRWRRLRGTPLDPFGHAAVRRVERALIAEYRGLVERAVATLSPETHERAVKLAGLPDLVRGYEDVKLRGVQRFREEARKLGF